MDRRAASLTVFLAKIIRREWPNPYAVLMSGYSSHPQGMAQSVCRLDVRVFLKQYRGPLLLPVGPFVCGLEQEVTRAYKQFLTGVPLGNLYGIYSLPFCLASSISSLASCMASQRCLTRNSCTASQASFWIWKRSMTRLALGNAVRTILRMESDKSSVTSSTA